MTSSRDAFPVIVARLAVLLDSTKAALITIPRLTHCVYFTWGTVGPWTAIGIALIVKLVAAAVRVLGGATPVGGAFAEFDARLGVEFARKGVSIGIRVRRAVDMDALTHAGTDPVLSVVAIDVIIRAVRVGDVVVLTLSDCNFQRPQRLPIYLRFNQVRTRVEFDGEYAVLIRCSHRFTIDQNDGPIHRFSSAIGHRTPYHPLALRDRRRWVTRRAARSSEESHYREAKY